MTEPEPPVSVLRVIEFIVAALLLLLLGASWLYGLLGRAWFGA